ncbi:hypothetical protein MAR_029335 [Mya arenaria]|uniref:Uncharacterized protein n=1 Tax=Mya arenaria TaxID=6604 RepID=A0ABY7DIW6_MYAAR|nr:hypothetical protein MAR_029335 [Mya arenaria]
MVERVGEGNDRRRWAANGEKEWEKEAIEGDGLLMERGKEEGGTVERVGEGNDRRRWAANGEVKKKGGVVERAGEGNDRWIWGANGEDKKKGDGRKSGRRKR